MPTRNINSDLKVNANLTLPSLSTYSGSETTALMIAGADVVGKRALGTNAFNSTSFLPLAGGTLTGSLQVSVGGAVGINIKQDTGSSAISGRLFFSNSTAGQGVSIYNGGDKMMFQTGATFNSSTGSTRMTIRSTGNVGIGTTSPDGQLHVKGSTNRTLKIDSTLVNGTGSFTTVSFARNGNDKWRIWQWGDDRALSFYNEATSSHQLTLKSDGNVGIGTVSPQGQLHINGGDLDTRGYNNENPTNSIYLNPTNGNSLGTSNTIGGGLIWKTYFANYTKKSAGILPIGEGSFFRTGLAFYTNNNADRTTDWSEKMRIDMDGNVGIGTVSPAVDLQIGDGTAEKTLRVFHSDNTYTQISGYGLFMSRGSSYIRPTADNSKGLYIGTSNYQWNLIAQDATNHTFSTNGSESVRITSAGNVGIGTTNPARTLDVVLPQVDLDD